MQQCYISFRDVIKIKAVFNMSLCIHFFHRAEKVVSENVSFPSHVKIRLNKNLFETGVICLTRFKVVSLQQTVYHIKQKQ